ncbi:MAG: hypothetical protein LBM23_09015 [Propionibacteriaceae bacterium]|jgi:hypothetical protein|nr:hypothetical protein [Propionibacteriaceae bacterium]
MNDDQRSDTSFVRDDPFYSESNMAALSESIDQADRGEFAMVTTVEGLERITRSWTGEFDLAPKSVGDQL